MKNKGSKYSQSEYGSISLTRPVTVKCWHVTGEIARAERRDEIHAVLLRANENGFTTAEDVATHLLFEKDGRRIVAERLLQIAVVYGLLEECDRQYTLTQAGQAAIEKELIMVPEQGAWTIWASNDPLLSSPVIHIDVWREPKLANDVNSEKGKFEKLPEWLHGVSNKDCTTLVKGYPLRILELERQAEVIDSQSSLTLVWSVAKSNVRITGRVSAEDTNAVLPAPSVSHEHVWLKLLESAHREDSWDHEKALLRIPFEKTTPAERESFIGAVEVERPVVDGYGLFDHTTVNSIPIDADSTEDAQRWATARLDKRISDYATQERFSVWQSEAVEPLAHFSPKTLSRVDLAKLAWSKKEDNQTVAWYLMAAEDWRL